MIVFTRTKRQAQRVADDLADRGFPASPLHGDMAQKAREKALDGFREGKVSILVATDVAARGIDVADVSHVINYTCPEDDKTYVHRIGRTGRAGATGNAITFVDWADLQRWKLINKTLDLPFDEPVETYSTSDHLFHDLGIDRNAKGRLKPTAPKESRSGDSGRSGQSSAKKSKDGQSRDGQRSNSNRQRTRTRSGSPVAAKENSGGQSTAAGEGQARRRRRRRRTGGEQGTPKPASD